MQTMMRIVNMLRDDDATTSVEYAVMLALILAVIIGGLTATGGGVSAWWDNIDNDLSAAGF